MDWRKIPSLPALRAFEAAARTGSLSEAARELNVTHAAIAQHLRTVETHLGLTLMQREGRGMALTPDGQRLVTPLTAAFELIVEGVRALTDADANRPLAVTLTPIFASKWLMPRLGGFWKDHPEVPLALHPDGRVVDLTRAGFDLGIRFGKGDWPGLLAERLVPARFVVVGAPSLVGDGPAPTLAELARLPWIIEDDWPEQRAWMRQFGVDPDQVRIVPVPTEELARTAARQGYGLHVEVAALHEDDVAAGRLRRLHTGGSDALGYYLVTRPGAVKPALRTFMRWLRSVA